MSDPTGTAVRRKSYSEKLRDPRWQKKRLKILDRDDWTCRTCWRSDKTLHVHHRWYESPDPWDTEDAALVTLCSDCHAYEHENRKDVEKRLLKVLAFMDAETLQHLLEVLVDMPHEVRYALAHSDVYPGAREHVRRWFDA